MSEIDQEKFVGEEQHCACFKTLLTSRLCIISHRYNICDKQVHRMLSSPMLCVMTSTDNIIDAVVKCIYIYDYPWP